MIPSYNYFIKNLPDDKETIKKFLQAIIELYEKVNLPLKAAVFSDKLDSLNSVDL
jgi:hypothetical protein